MIGLSKSKYCRGFQCPKMLWMDKNMPEVGVATTPDSIFENGNMVGDLARSYYGDYVLVDFAEDVTAMVKQTAELLQTNADNIAEASFSIDGLYCAVDILHRDGDGWDIVEVKSSTHVSPIYIEDMAFQNYVLTKCGIKVKKVYNLHLNSEYVRHGDLNLQELFELRDCTEKCKEKFDEVETNIKAMRAFADVAEEPVKDLDVCCQSPYECAYRGYCGKHIPEQSVFNVSRLSAEKKYEYYHQGIVSFEDILKADIDLNERQRLQVETAVKKLPDTVNKKAIREFLNTLSYPIYHLDFETYQQAIPQYEGSSPYSQIPFQYSLHIEYEDGRIEHKEFLAKEGTDPRRALAESLCRDIPRDVCGLAYNKSFERTVISKLAYLFPDLAEHLMSIRENIHDLMVPFSEGHYYSEAMQGSYSIKNVLPALCPGDPELDYHNLEGVHNGAEAAAVFPDLVNRTPEEIAIIREQLLKYCGLDTYAMVKVLGKLREAVKET